MLHRWAALVGALALAVVVVLATDPAAAREPRGGWGGGGWGYYGGNWGGPWYGNAYGRDYGWGYPYGGYYGSRWYRPNWNYGYDWNNYGYSTYSYPMDYYSSDYGQPYQSGPGTTFDGQEGAYGAMADDTQAVRVTVRVAPDAEIWFDDNKTTQRGPVRTFVSPPLEPNHTYTYHIKARWKENGKDVERTRNVQVQAGDFKTVDFMGQERRYGREAERDTGIQDRELRGTGERDLNKGATERNRDTLDRNRDTGTERNRDTGTKRSQPSRPADDTGLPSEKPATDTNKKPPSP
jgi:uncharacterized protein (TIGR03000 family)